MYYGVNEEDQRKKQEDVLNINSTHFKADKYLEQLYKTSDLQNLKTEKEKTKAGMSLNLDGCYCTVWPVEMILLERPKIFNELNFFTHNIEIRELDGDMQRLVYENYSKFIKATDMIREVFEAH